MVRGRAISLREGVSRGGSSRWGCRKGTWEKRRGEGGSTGFSFAIEGRAGCEGADEE